MKGGKDCSRRSGESESIQKRDGESRIGENGIHVVIILGIFPMPYSEREQGLMNEPTIIGVPLAVLTMTSGILGYNPGRFLGVISVPFAEHELQSFLRIRIDVAAQTVHFMPLPEQTQMGVELCLGVADTLVLYAHPNIALLSVVPNRNNHVVRDPGR